MRSTLKNIPYNDITKINKIPKNIFVLIIAKISNAFESLNAKIWVIVIVMITKIVNASKENKPITEENIKNHKENPAVTAAALNLGDDNSI